MMNPKSGSLYVIEFSTGIVKVGRSENPTQRLQAHRGHAYSLGVAILYDWYSPVINNFIVAEQTLINWCVHRATTQRSAEYFTGIDPHEAVMFAETLIMASDKKWTYRDMLVKWSISNETGRTLADL